MIRPVSAIWLKFCNRCITSSLGRVLSRLWHSAMPSFPVRRRIFDLEIYFDSRDHPFVWFSPRKSMEEVENVPALLSKFQGRFWDVGTNAGIYALWMAARGNPVVAFDISPKCISYVMKSAAHNGLKNVTGVARAFSTEPFQYQMPQTAIASNKLQTGSNSTDAVAITYQEAAAQFGIPKVIKMDIEGHEEVFLRSKEFKQWLVDNGISLFLEIHKEAFREMLWKDMDCSWISQNMAFIQPRSSAEMSLASHPAAK